MIALLLAARAHAGCAENPVLPTGPVQAWLWEGQLGLARSTCASTAVGLAPRALLVVDTPNFYGHLVGTGTFDAAVAVDERTEVDLALEVAHYDSTISAITSSFIGYGATTLSVLRRIEREEGPLELAMLARATLPTPVGMSNNPVLGTEVGLLAATRGAGPLEAHGQVGMVLSGGLSAPTDLRSAIPVTVGGGWSASRHFGLALDAVTAVGYYAPVDHVAVAPAVRVAANTWSMELGAAVPLAGRERALAAVRLGFRYHPGPRPGGP